ncbi:DUF6596 domain-containing protein [Streptomyces zaomyceticus]|uniref:DUF6596 domain-containing protein n=1 Tax=Streptomyces zaomyceticus TaxID=68286 RepID=UPI0037985F02
MDEALLRSLTPGVLDALVRRGADFAAAEDAVQDARVEAVRGWPEDPLRDPKGRLVTVAWRKFPDTTRADTARRRREGLVEEEPQPGPAPAEDDTLRLYFLCARPSPSSSSAVALTLRAVGGLTTHQIAQDCPVAEATTARRVSRAERTVSGVRFDRPGEVATVLRVLHLVFDEGCSGDVDLAAEAIRLTRQPTAVIDRPEVAGLLALMLLHHARRAGRTAPDAAWCPRPRRTRLPEHDSDTPPASTPAGAAEGLPIGRAAEGLAPVGTRGPHPLTRRRVRSPADACEEARRAHAPGVRQPGRRGETRDRARCGARQLRASPMEFCQYVTRSELSTYTPLPASRGLAVVPLVKPTVRLVVV